MKLNSSKNNRQVQQKPLGIGTTHDEDVSHSCASSSSGCRQQAARVKLKFTTFAFRNQCMASPNTADSSSF